MCSAAGENSRTQELKNSRIKSGEEINAEMQRRREEAAAIVVFGGER
jgi:hypothetical protein